MVDTYQLSWRALPNPFSNVTTTNILPGHVSGRRTDIIEIISNIPSAILLAGTPGIGKSTLIRYLQISPDAPWSWRNELQNIRKELGLDHLHFVQVDLSPLEGINDESRIYDQFIQQCYYAIYKEYYGQKTSEPSSLNALRDLVRSISWEAANVRYIVMLDNIERLGRQGLQIFNIQVDGQTPLERAISLLDHSKVIRTLVDLMDEFSNFGVILSIRSLPRPKFVDQFTYVSADLARFTAMILQIFTLQEAQEFIGQELKSGLAEKFRDVDVSRIFSDTEQEWLLEQAGSHPYLLQQFCFRTFQLKQKSAGINGRWIELVQSDKTQLLEELKRVLSPFLANIWQRLEEALDKSSQTTRDKFYDFVNGLADKKATDILNGVDWENFGSELRYILFSEGIVRYDLYHDIYFPGAMLRDYLMQKAKATSIRPTPSSGRGANIIYITRLGKTPDSFSLSDIEYRMLKLLLQTPDNSSEEDLMKAGWGRKVDRQVFTQRMHHLRRKLRERCGGVEVIENRYGGRYSLIHPDWFRLSE